GGGGGGGGGGARGGRPVWGRGRGRRASGSIPCAGAGQSAWRGGSPLLSLPAASEDRRVTWAGFVWKNLLRRRARTALTSAGVAIGVGLIVALLSIAAGGRRAADDLLPIGRAGFGLFPNGAPPPPAPLPPPTP